jgi:hypothetical protein
MEIRVKVNEGGCLRVYDIEKGMIIIYLEAGVFTDIRVSYMDLTLAEIESLTQQGVSVRTDGDSREVVIFRVTPLKGRSESFFPFNFALAFLIYYISSLLFLLLLLLLPQSLWRFFLLFF